MNKNILLISPFSDNEALWVTGNEGPEVKNILIPLGLATIAALTPEEFCVDIWDEVIRGCIDDGTKFKKKYGLVGITGYKAHHKRCREIATIFRKQGILSAIGGPGVSETPDHYRGDFDIMFIGEAEKTWPLFLKEWEKGSYKSEYRQIEKIDLAESPIPKWDSILADVSKYSLGCVQTTRGCPFDCEFCDVIYLFGRRSRHKPIENILEEVKIIERLGLRTIFFSDDEFIGDRKYAKDLLRALIPVNQSFSKPLTFSTQLTIGVSSDEELLKLLAEANFNMLFIGIETPNKDSLKETNKLHNIRKDLVGEVHKILSYGIAIRAGIIVGFDHDDTDIFDIQYDFIQKACIPSLAVNMLKAPLGTRLWTRLRQEGRVVSLVKVKDQLGHPRSYTNIIPKRMSRVELMNGYRYLLEKVYSWESFSERIKGFISHVRYSIKVHGDPITFEEMDKLGVSQNLGKEESSTIGEILTYADQKNPETKTRVMELIIQHIRYRESINMLLKQLDRQIDLESEGTLTFEKEVRPIQIPPAFRKEYKTIFKDIYSYVTKNLDDKRDTAKALVEIFTDFLVRSGKELNKLEPHHISFLYEVCDRTCNKFNNQLSDILVEDGFDKTAIKSTKPFYLREDVLKGVEQELFKCGA